VALVALAGCAKKEGTPGAQSPDATTSGDSAAPGAAVQVGISDAPTSGEVTTERPQMNASAAEAYAAGLAAFKVGDLRGAKTQFQRATQADSKAFQAYYSLGVVEERLNEISNAVSSYRQATVIVSDYEPAIAAYAILLAKSGKPEQGVDYLNGRMSAMPKSAAVSAAMAEVKSIQGDSGAAQRLAQEALKKNPDYSPAMVTLARDHYRARRLDLALYTLKAILDGDGTENPPRDKNNADARLLRGLILKEQGNRPAAIDEFEKSIALRPDLVESRVHLAAYYLESGNATGAAPLLENAVRYDNDHVLAHLNLGDAYRLLGKTAEARRELEWVQKKDPQLAQVHYNLGLLYLFSDNVPGMTPTQATDSAIAELEQYKKMRPRQAGSNDDTDELITRAKAKKGILDAAAAESAAAAKPAAPAAPATAPKDAGGMTATPPAAPKK
ncbi:MAG TPA: tetratricopeptide repeat protein, partial [Polyangiaceae bacterium]|nr:tetratricopeptide repeat protein [Polyangiaceae bacterium]